MEWLNAVIDHGGFGARGLGPRSWHPGEAAEILQANTANWWMPTSLWASDHRLPANCTRLPQAQRRPSSQTCGHIETGLRVSTRKI